MYVLFPVEHALFVYIVEYDLGLCGASFRIGLKISQLSPAGALT